MVLQHMLEFNHCQKIFCDWHIICKIQGLFFVCVFNLRVFGYTRLRKIINIEKIVQFAMQNSVIHDFRARSSGSQLSMGMSFSFYAILGLHGAFRNITPCISEKARYGIVRLLIVDLIGGNLLYVKHYRSLVGKIHAKVENMMSQLTTM